MTTAISTAGHLPFVKRAFQGWRNHQILFVVKMLLWVNFYSAIVCFPGTLIELQWT